MNSFALQIYTIFGIKQSQPFNMKNPLKLFHNLLYNSNALNPATLISAEDEKISLFDKDITDLIIEEAGKVYLAIDEEYWKGSKSDNENYLSKLVNISNKLITISEGQIEAHVERIVMNQDLNNWLLVYNNTQCVYENLLAIRNHILDYYCDGIKELESKGMVNKKYPYLFALWAEDLRDKCLCNLGKIDTEFIVKTGIQDFSIKVQTAKLHCVMADLDLEKNQIAHADLINVQDSKSTKDVLEWKGTPKDFIYYFSPIIKSKMLTINGRQDRAPLVNALHEAFNIRVMDKTSKLEKRIALETLQSYFKKEASGEVY